MSLTININGITLCHKGSKGISRNTLPNVCKTPPQSIPIPYANVAFSKNLVQGTHSVFVDGGNMVAHNKSNFASSIMDEPGTLGGIISGVHGSKAEWISHSFDVFFERKPACRLTDKMFMNKKNTVNLAGLLQKALGNSQKEFEELICKWAKECFIEHCNRLGSKKSGAKYAHFQDCLNEKIRNDAYDKNNRYPNGDIGNEVSFKKVNGKWEPIKSKSNPNSFSNAWTPKGGRRLDITVSRNGKITALYDVKFPGDRYTPAQWYDYKDIAKNIKAEFEDFELRTKCSDWPEECPNKKPEPVKEPVTVEETSTETNVNWWLVGGLTAVAVAVTICPLDGPVGDAVAWSAVMAALQ